ncbi:universal stress family protein [Haemophilus pittmaniae HK 85]|jgi:universal stress protein E homolog|uniref:Universal stress protein UspE n=2 Tax=Haemophilus pittmaniae TaxID=249188 RepID=A0A377IZY3_9PAST|nr:universal stress protein UspE [Haemophilus pittmaniae]EGV05351.1 universal stress family protein [Haemophilus pittmaniae HK 85]MBS6027636.1 universal stress protein UspE [Haemophilus pittmaniae]SNV84616.1 universal stress protein UspE [Haemophilus pittmaniae]STO93821.1 universal stress protein UspE [Haemophilus pittmaniae]
MKFNNILVVLNPDNEKQYALARAVRLAREQKHDDKIKITVLLTVYDLSYEMSALLSSEERQEMHNTAIEQQRQAVQFYLDKYAEPDIEFDSHIVWNSNEADAIREEVENNQYDLVVKYTKDEESFTSLIFTPVDWQLLRKCPVPVLMVRDGDWKHQRRILIAVNVSGEQEYQNEFNLELVETGMSLAENLNRGNVHLVSAYPVAPINMAIDLPEFNTSGYENGIRGQHLINMKALRQQFCIDEDHTHVREGFPEDVIPQVAKEIEAELVILGTVGRTGLSAALLGNTAEHVINKLSCNLLAIKPSKK